jgi:GntR family transcriptional regulator, transcriptional repressor for pyruvate dehydrogenase complex
MNAVPTSSDHARSSFVPGLVRTTLTDQLVLHIARGIVRGDLAVGDPLDSEQELATAFNVSKPTLRESMRALVGLGLIHAQQGKRTVVQSETSWNVLDPLVQEAFRLEGRGEALAIQLYDMRVILETSSASRAAERASAEQVEQLRSMIEQLREIAASPEHDLDAFLRVDREFHDVIAQASGNQVLRQVVRQVNGDLSTAWSSSSITESELDLLVDMHAAITDAIADGDAERAAGAMDVHLKRAAAKTIRPDR